MLTIDNRPCKIGNSINLRTERHGDEDVPACDIPLAGIMLQPDELNALLDDSRAHKALFTQAKNGKPAEPAFQKFKAFAMKDKFEGAAVVLIVGLTETEIELGEVNLARIMLEPQVGGMTEVSLQVQAKPDSDDLAHLVQFMNHDANVTIQFGKLVESKKSKQQQLGLSVGKNGDSDDSGAEARTH